MNPPPDEPDHHQIEACGLRMGRPSFIFQSIFPKFRIAPLALAPLPPQVKNATYGPGEAGQARVCYTAGRVFKALIGLKLGRKGGSVN